MFSIEIATLTGMAGVFLISYVLITVRNQRNYSRINSKINQVFTEVRKINQMLGDEVPKDEELLIDSFNEVKLYVGNIDYSASEDELARLFEKYGQVEVVNIPIDRHNGKARGFGFVTFKTQKDATNAMDLHGTEFKGRQIQVNFARERKG